MPIIEFQAENMENMARPLWMRGVYCFTGILDSGNELAASFASSCLGRGSPLLWRVPIFIWAVSITLWSIVCFWGPRGMFFVYMTHWGLLFIILETLFGIVVATKKPHEKFPDATFGLPWYVKTYWVLYNITIPVAYLITVFYWGILKTSLNTVNYAPNPVLDIMLHGVNALVMTIELVCSAHPSRLMHIMQPLYFAGAYMLFSVVYYFAGGVDPWGNSFIYPVVDWSKPEKTIVVITLTALFLALMHLVVVGVAKLRDIIATRPMRSVSGVYNEGFVPSI